MIPVKYQTSLYTAHQRMKARTKNNKRIWKAPQLNVSESQEQKEIMSVVHKPEKIICERGKNDSLSAKTSALEFKIPTKVNAGKSFVNPKIKDLHSKQLPKSFDISPLHKSVVMKQFINSTYVDSKQTDKSKKVFINTSHPEFAKALNNIRGNSVNTDSSTRPSTSDFLRTANKSIHVNVHHPGFAKAKAMQYMEFNETKLETSKAMGSCANKVDLKPSKLNKVYVNSNHPDFAKKFITNGSNSSKPMAVRFGKEVVTPNVAANCDKSMSHFRNKSYQVVSRKAAKPNTVAKPKLNIGSVRRVSPVDIVPFSNEAHSTKTCSPSQLQFTFDKNSKIKSDSFYSLETKTNIEPTHVLSHVQPDTESFAQTTLEGSQLSEDQISLKLGNVKKVFVNSRHPGFAHTFSNEFLNHSKFIVSETVRESVAPTKKLENGKHDSDRDKLTQEGVLNETVKQDDLPTQVPIVMPQNETSTFAKITSFNVESESKTSTPPQSLKFHSQNRKRKSDTSLLVVSKTKLLRKNSRLKPQLPNQTYSKITPLYRQSNSSFVSLSKMKLVHRNSLHKLNSVSKAKCVPSSTSNTIDNHRKKCFVVLSKNKIVKRNVTNEIKLDITSSGNALISSSHSVNKADKITNIIPKRKRSNSSSTLVALSKTKLVRKKSSCHADYPGLNSKSYPAGKLITLNKNKLIRSQKACVNDSTKFTLKQNAVTRTAFSPMKLIRNASNILISTLPNFSKHSHFTNIKCRKSNPMVKNNLLPQCSNSLYDQTSFHINHSKTQTGSLLSLSKTKLIRQTNIPKSLNEVHKTTLGNQDRCFTSLSKTKLVRNAVGSQSKRRRNSNSLKSELITRKNTQLKLPHSSHSKYKLITSSRRSMQIDRLTTLKRKNRDLQWKKSKYSPKKQVQVPISLVNIGGILYRSSRNKLIRSTVGKGVCNGSQDNISAVVNVRGCRFSLDRSGKTLRRLGGTKGPTRLQIGGVTFKQSAEGNVLCRSDVDTTQSRIKIAKQKSIQQLTKRLRKNNEPCPFFHKFGKCNGREKGTCPRVHDLRNVAVCKKFVQGCCEDTGCLLSHALSLEKMPTCHHFLAGLCVRESCPYLHVKLSDKAPICTHFLHGFCPKADQCKRRHEYVCPVYAKTGVCKKGKACDYPHPRDRGKVAQSNRRKQRARAVEAEAAVVSTVRYYLPGESQPPEQHGNGTAGYISDSECDVTLDDGPSWLAKRTKVGDLPMFIPLSSEEETQVEAIPHDPIKSE